MATCEIVITKALAPHTQYPKRLNQHLLYSSFWEVFMNKKKAWSYAFGLIKVDGLKPSNDFVRMADIEKSLNAKYRMK